MDEFERAKDKIMMGAERRSMVMSEEEEAEHGVSRAGHAIVGVDPEARSGVQGDDHSARPRAGRHAVPAGRAIATATASSARSSIAALFGGRDRGRAAFGPTGVTTGASNDIERAPMLARSMVTKWGLSDKLGPLTYSKRR
jgi:cell division protease FtsH